MSQLTDKIEQGLSENRILILGAQVVLGFQYTAFFQTAMDSLPARDQNYMVAGLALMLIAFAFFLAPTSCHILVNRGKLSESFSDFINRAITVALFPFALALSIDLYVAFHTVTSSFWSAVVAALAFLFASGIWFVLGYSTNFKGVRRVVSNSYTTLMDISSKDKIHNAMTEAKTVIPGSQALLGFQFTIILTDVFQKLPNELKIIHLIALGLITVSIILLMTPAAYHRIALDGEDTEGFGKFVNKILLVALVPLSLGVCLDYFVVASMVLTNKTAIAVSTALIFILFFGLLFGYSWYKRLHLANRV